MFLRTTPQGKLGGQKNRKAKAGICTEVLELVELLASGTLDEIETLDL